MVDVLNRFFGRKEEERMSKMKPEKKAEERVFSTNLNTWMKGASAVGLDGETSDVEKTFLVGDLPDLSKEVPVAPVAPKEVKKTPERHGLHLVPAEASNVDVGDKTAELEAKLIQAMGSLDGLQSQLAVVKAGLRDILDQLAVEKAKAKVQDVA